MSLFRIFLRVSALLATLTLAQAQAIPPRAALVIGNSDYSFGPLRNPRNDAEAMAKALGEAGFDVTVATDADQAAMEKAVHAFGAKLKAKGGVGLFYFSGHGAQINGENYLIPVSLTSAEEIKSGSVSASEIVDAMAGAHNGLNIVILDACRNNPMDPNGAHGLSRIDSNASLFVSYATSPGAVALDGAGNNSPYTKYLSQSIATPNLDIEDTFKRTLKGVYQDTHGEQVPWISSTFFGDFVFRPEGAEASEQEEQEEQVEEPAEAATAPNLTGVYRASGTNPNGSKYTGMVALNQEKDDFKLTWWIGKDEFHGSGHYAGKMLVINWGDKTPVIYSFGDEGALDGEWADGSATETLTPVGAATTEDVSPPEGEYSVEGRNIDGQEYSGTVTIAKEADDYKLTWKVGDSEYEGDGKLEDNLLTVNWGNSTPVVYALGDDGSLKGLWAAGHGEETLTPEQ